MPQKVWAVGEEVLAADFNTYLQQQVVATFATVAARDAWASPPNGALAVTLDTYTTWIRVAGVWQLYQNPPACRVYHNALQPIGNAAETTVAFNSERFDFGALHDPVTNNSRITFTVPGLYVLTFTGMWESAGDYRFIMMKFRLNGTTEIGFMSTTSAIIVANPLVSLTTLYKMAAGDYAEVRAYQNNTAGVARNLGLASGSNAACEFAAVWVGNG